jgi:apolipoprotein N-acyltransferase
MPGVAAVPPRVPAVTAVWVLATMRLLAAMPMWVLAALWVLVAVVLLLLPRVPPCCRRRCRCSATIRLALRCRIHAQGGFAGDGVQRR